MNWLAKLKKMDLKNLEMTFELPNLFRVYPSLNRLVFRQGFLDVNESSLVDLSLAEINLTDSKIFINLSKGKVLESGLYFVVGDGLEYEITLNLNESSKCKVFLIHQSSQKLSLQINLNGKNAQLEVYTLDVLNGSAVSELEIEVAHKAENTESKILVRSILEDSAKFSFLGRIKIEKLAQKSVASLLNKNIMLSDKAKVKTEPELEILADDVKCSHGASIGGVDSQILFYLMSRGFDSDSAKSLIVQSLINDLLVLPSLG